MPEGLIDQCLELNSTIFSKENCDAHLAVTLQAGHRTRRKRGFPHWF